LFYSEKDRQSQSALSEVVGAEKHLKDFVEIGVLNIDVDQQVVKELGLNEFPTLLLFPFGDKRTPEKYKGKLTASDISNFGLSKIPNFVSKVNNEFLESNPMKPKVILFSTKETSSALFKTLAKIFRDKMMFGLVSQSSTNLVNQFKVTKFPQVIMISAPNTPPIPYEGSLNFQEMQKFLTQLLKKVDEEQKKDTSGIFLELTSKTKSLCPKDSICAMFFLDPMTKSTYIPILQQIQTAHSKFNVMWIDRTKQSSFEEVFYGGPATQGVLVYNYKRNKFVWMEDVDITQKTVTQFIEKIISGDVFWNRVHDNEPFLKLRN